MHHKLIPSILSGREISDEMRYIFRLPVRMGGMGFLDPSAEAEFEYENSKIATEQLTKAIFEQNSCLEVDDSLYKEAIGKIRQRKNERLQYLMENVKDRVDEKMVKLLELSSEKGASLWLTSLPIKKLGFRTNKQQFDDAICMRYDIPLKDVPRKCVCGKSYSINHCLTCATGGFVHMRHNKVRDTLAEIIEEICKDVTTEPPLIPLTGETLNAGANTTDNARSDVSAIGLWQPLEKAFIDIAVFNPLAQTNWNQSIDQMYSTHEQRKKREYNERILQVEHGSFTPAIFSCSGGASHEAERLIKQVAAKLAKKKGEQYSDVVNYVRKRIRFDILKTCLLSFRGNKQASKKVLPVHDIDFSLQTEKY